MTSMADRIAVIKRVDMDKEMQDFAISTTNDSMEKMEAPNSMALHIKKVFDKRYGPSWHCIVGKNFGCDVVFQPRCLFYFYLGNLGILLFKSKEEHLKTK